MREIMQAHGARLRPVPVDDEGLLCAALPEEGAKLVCVSPSHQFPSGALLSLTRRLELLRYAGRYRSWIIEDDYDGEFRFDAKPISALRTFDEADRVIYIGSFSKILFPALRLGYMVLPAALRGDFIATKRLADFGCPTIEQKALANFMESPGFDRHLRSASATLKTRRKALLTGLETHAGDRVDVVDAPAGMHTVVWLRDCTFDECERLISDARSVGLGLYPIEPHYVNKPLRPGLLLGYAGLSSDDIATAMQLFGKCLAQLKVAARRQSAA
jgi:GntR family transcriptional regulator/MocR family aminotransferase